MNATVFSRHYFRLATRFVERSSQGLLGLLLCLFSTLSMAADEPQQNKSTPTTSRPETESQIRFLEPFAIDPSAENRHLSRPLVAKDGVELRFVDSQIVPSVPDARIDKTKAPEPAGLLIPLPVVTSSNDIRSQLAASTKAEPLVSGAQAMEPSESNLSTSAEFTSRQSEPLAGGLRMQGVSSSPFFSLVASQLPAFMALYAEEEISGPADDPAAADMHEEPTGEKLTDSFKEGQESLGQAPPDRGMQFLRRQAVLLPRGELQWDVGLNYTLFESEFPQLIDTIPGPPPEGVVDTNVRQRILTMPLEIRYGLTSKTQLSLYVPFGWVNTEVSTPALAIDDFDNSGGLGDITFSLSHHLRRSCGCCADPDIIATFGTTAPTGESSIVQALLGNPSGQLGGGFWAASWNLLFIHNYDPMTVFYSLGSRHRFSRTLQGIDVTPGDEFIYQLGVGFAVNSSVTLSSSFLGEYISEPTLDDIRQAGLIREPMRMRFAATIANPCRSHLVEPFAEIGMTDSAPSARFGITWTR